MERWRRQSGNTWAGMVEFYNACYTFTMQNGIPLNTSAITHGPAALHGTWLGTHCGERRPEPLILSSVCTTLAVCRRAQCGMPLIRGVSTMVMDRHVLYRHDRDGTTGKRKCTNKVC